MSGFVRFYLGERVAFLLSEWLFSRVRIQRVPLRLFKGGNFWQVAQQLSRKNTHPTAERPSAQSDGRNFLAEPWSGFFKRADRPSHLRAPDCGYLMWTALGLTTV